MRRSFAVQQAQHGDGELVVDAGDALHAEVAVLVAVDDLQRSDAPARTLVRVVHAHHSVHVHLHPSIHDQTR